MTNLQKSIFTLLLLVVFFGMKHWLAVTQPDQQWCDTVKVIGGWQECHLVDRTAWFVGLRGCDGHDAHLYKVTGKLATGADAEAVVCCGAVFNGCTLHAAH